MTDLFPTLSIQMFNWGLTLSFEANAAIANGQAVKLVAVPGGLPKVVAAGASDKAIQILISSQH